MPGAIRRSELAWERWRLAGGREAFECITRFYTLNKLKRSWIFPGTLLLRAATDCVLTWPIAKATSHVRALVVTTNTRTDNMCHTYQVPFWAVQHPGAVVLLYSTNPIRVGPSMDSQAVQALDSPRGVTHRLVRRRRPASDYVHRRSSINP